MSASVLGGPSGVLTRLEMGESPTDDCDPGPSLDDRPDYQIGGHAVGVYARGHLRCRWQRVCSDVNHLGPCAPRAQARTWLERPSHDGLYEAVRWPSERPGTRQPLPPWRSERSTAGGAKQVSS